MHYFLLVNILILFKPFCFAKRYADHEKTEGFSSLNVDSFITQVLTSDKFDVLVNKIAEKTAEKLQNKSEVNVTNSETIYRSIINDTTPIKKNKKSQKSIFQYNSNEILLKYKKFTKKNKRLNIVRKNKNIINPETLTTENIKPDEKVTHLDSQLFVSKSQSKETTTKKKHRNAVKNDDTTAEISPAVDDSQSDDSSRESFSIVTKKQLQTEHQTEDPFKNDQSEDSSSDIEKKSTYSVNTREASSTSHPFATTNYNADNIELNLKGGAREKVPLTFRTEISIESSDDEDNEVSQPRKSYRVEGNKNYTYMSSAEYKEYHDLLRKQMIQRKKFI